MTHPPAGPDVQPSTPSHREAFARLGKILHRSADDFSLGQVLQQVAEAAHQVLPGLGEVSVTLMEGSRPRTVVSTGAVASLLDERQHELGSGPAFDAAVSGSTITLETADPGSVYPELSRLAAARGVTRVLSVGLPLPLRTVGALTLYSCDDRPAPPDAVVLAQAFAGYAAVAVANATLYNSADEAWAMGEVMGTRAVVEQAKGFLMTSRPCSAEQAFTLLTRTAQRQGRGLGDVAADLLAEGSTAPGRTSPPT